MTNTTQKTWSDGKHTSTHACCSRCALDFPHDSSYHEDMVTQALAKHDGHRLSCGYCLDCKEGVV